MFHFDYPCDVIILAGQSNAEGFGLGECENPYEKDERVLWLGAKIPCYKPIEENPTVNYLDVKGCLENTIGLAELGERGCFAHYFAREYIKNGFLKEDRKLMIVNAAVGGTGFVDTFWGLGKSERATGLWTSDGPLYKRMIAQIDDALRLNPDNKIVGILWHQGENNVNFCDDFSLIEEKSYKWLQNLIHDVKEHCGLQELPVVCGEFVKDGWYREHKECCDVVMKAMEELMRDIGGGFVKSDGLLSNDQKVHNGDGIHFCHDSLRILGERYFEEYAKIVK